MRVTSSLPTTTCPFCGSSLEITDAGGNPWFECGTTMGFRSNVCRGREPMAVKLREAQERIKKLEEWIESLEILEQHSTVLPEREWFGSEIGYLRKGQFAYKGDAKP